MSLKTRSGVSFFDLLLRDAAVLHRRAVIALRFEHGRNHLSNRFLIVHDEYVFQQYDDCSRFEKAIRASLDSAATMPRLP